MKKAQKIVLAITVLAIFILTQTTSAQVKDLSNKETRSEIMNAIASDSVMSNEMIRIMMNKKDGMMMLQHHKMMNVGDRSSMLNMMKKNPGMMNNMLSAMMETANADTTILLSMIKTIRDNPQMMNMIKNMRNKKNRQMMNDKYNLGGMMNGWED